MRTHRLMTFFIALVDELPKETYWFHVGGVAGRDRHHRHFGQFVVAGFVGGQAQGARHGLPRGTYGSLASPGKCTGATTSTAHLPTAASRSTAAIGFGLGGLSVAARACAVSTWPRALLHPYLVGDGVETCPSLAYVDARF